MVGVNTVIADDPRLTARDDDGEPLDRQPLRVVVDSRGRTPAEARLLSEPGRTVVAVAGADAPAADRLSGAGAEVERVAGADGMVDLAELLSRLALGREITSLLVEGGGTLLGSLFDQRLVDKVVAFVAPAVIGGRDAPAPVGGTGVQMAADAFRLQRVEVLHLGGDVAMIGYL
jgi:diaminohydroxyphosphoribosylaminopyrimidine deaminase/5-amino-6-(5-phosphoribosylamino)uracil reductase